MKKIIKIDGPKSLEKPQHFFTVTRKKILNQLGKEENLHNAMKNIYKMLELTSLLMVETGCFLSKIRNKARLSSLTFQFNILLKVLASAIRQKNKINGTWIGNK